MLFVNLVRSVLNEYNLNATLKCGINSQNLRLLQLIKIIFLIFSIFYDFFTNCKIFIITLDFSLFDI